MWSSPQLAVLVVKVTHGCYELQCEHGLEEMREFHVHADTVLGEEGGGDQPRSWKGGGRYSFMV